MQTVHLRQSIASNCSLIAWCLPAREFTNDIQMLISRYNIIPIKCGSHTYIFNHLPNNPPAIPFSFSETNLLMQLMPEESDSFYLKAAIREYVNAFTVFNSKDERVYPEDII